MGDQVVSAAFFSRSTEGEVGSFYYPLGMIVFTLSDPAKAVLDQIRNNQPIRVEDYSHDALLHIAYEVTSLFHEVRHYFDAFGTLAGCSLFSGRLSVLKKFAQIGQTLNQVGFPWSLPLADWAKSPDCPQPIRDFIRNATGFEIAAELYVSPFSPVEVNGHIDSLSTELPYEGGGTADAFPLRFLRIGNDGGESLRSVLLPIGLEALMEGNAHAVCRELTGYYFPPDIALELALPQRTTVMVEPGDDREQAVARASMPYMVTDLLISRYFARNGIPHFPIDLILALTDHVLVRGSIRAADVSPGVTALHVDRLGSHLVALLEHCDPETLASGVLPESSGMELAYDGMLASFEQNGDWDTIDDDRSPLSSLAIWEAYVAKRCIVPLLRQRKISSNEAFRSVSGFIVALNEVGMPPVRVANGKLLFDSMPPRVQSAWWQQLMLGEILRQLVSGDAVVFCPRAHGTLPGINTENLAIDGDCQRHLLLGSGTFRKAQAAFQPDCLFESALKACGIQRSHN